VRAGFVVATLVVTAALAPRPAAGTIYAAMDDDTLVGRAAVIVAGSVSKVSSHRRDGRIVTDTVLQVTRVVKGAVELSTVTVTTPGGTVGDVSLVLPGVPTFRVGESVLAFLEHGSPRTLRPVALGLGVFRLLSPATSDAAVRTEPFPETRTVGEFAAIVQAQADPGDRVVGGSTSEGDASGDGAPVVDEFTFLGSPPSRFFEPDRNVPVRYRLANFDPDLGQSVSTSVVDAALSAWTSVVDASIVLLRGSPTSPARSVAGGTCDGQSIIQFDDPFGEVSPLSSCSGVLAVGGFCTEGTGIVGGKQYRRISEGDLVINNGLGDCIQRKGFEEIMTHEIGHTIGLGHSSENPNEPSQQLRDATMFFLAHFDGRGASLRADDVAGVSALYQSQADPNDLDADGVPNADDDCPATPEGDAVDDNGCACGEANHVPCDDGLICTFDVCSRATGRCIAPGVDCTDGNACLIGSCGEEAGCSTTPVTGTLAIVCPYENVFPPNACAGERVPGGAVRRFRKIGKLAGKAVVSRDPALVARARTRLDRLRAIIERAGTRNRRPLTASCVGTVVAVLDDARARLTALD
jgi:hypothetical protein